MNPPNLYIRIINLSLFLCIYIKYVNPIHCILYTCYSTLCITLLFSLYTYWVRHHQLKTKYIHDQQSCV